MHIIDSNTLYMYAYMSVPLTCTSKLSTDKNWSLKNLFSTNVLNLSFGVSVWFDSFRAESERKWLKYARYDHNAATQTKYGQYKSKYSRYMQPPEPKFIQCISNRLLIVFSVSMDGITIQKVTIRI